MLSGTSCDATYLLEVVDPAGAFPDYSFACRQRRADTAEHLAASGVDFASDEFDLLSDENDLLGIYQKLLPEDPETVLVLDISSLPKRFFCFILSRLLRPGPPNDLIVTYTQAGSGWYTTDRLCDDPMTPEPLPGYGMMAKEDASLAVSVGFEPLGVPILLERYKDRRKGVRVLLSFPPNGHGIRRAWNMLRRIANEVGGEERLRENLEVVAAWDTDAAYRSLERWDAESNGQVLAPFGAKPHALAMALYAIKKGYPLWYSQPKSYHPDYTRGIGVSWAYVVKWQGVPCFDRPEVQA